MVKQIEKTIGFKSYNNDGTITFGGGYTENGTCYKDKSAWEQNNGVIYISEYDLIDLHTGEITEDDLWTRKDWVKFVKDYITEYYKGEDYFDDIIECNEFIEYLAYDIFDNADWQDLSTLLNEYDYNNDWVFDNWECWKMLKQG